MTVVISRGDLMQLSAVCLAYAAHLQQDALQCSGEQQDNMLRRAQGWAKASRRIKDIADAHPMYERKEVLELGIEIR